MRWMAALSWRLPERLNRICPSVLPDHTGMGATPAWQANAASLLNRATPAASPTSLAAVSSAQPGNVQQCRGDLAGPLAEALCPSAVISVVSRMTSASSARAISATSPGTVSSQPAQRLLVLGGFQRARLRPALGVEFMDMPPQPVDRRRTLGDKHIAAIGKQLQLTRHLIMRGHRQIGFAQHRPRHRFGVDGIGLTPRARGLAGLGHQLGRAPAPPAGRRPADRVPAARTCCGSPRYPTSDRCRTARAPT